MDSTERESFLNGKTDQHFRCQICETFWGTKDGSGIVDRPVITPCYHIFGEKCLKHRMALDKENLRSPCCPNSDCGRLLVYQACGHTVKPVQIPLRDVGDGLMLAGLSNPMPFLLEDYQMPDNCRPCASKMLRFQSIYGDLEKHFRNFLVRRAWVSEGVEKRGLSRVLLDKVNEDIRKCQADMEVLKSSVAEEWEDFVKYRFGCIPFSMTASTGGQASLPAYLTSEAPG